MRTGFVVGGVVLVALGALLASLGTFALSLVAIGVVLLIAGVLMPGKSALPLPPPDFASLLVARLYQVEQRQISMEDRLRRIEETMRLPAVQAPPPRAPEPLYAPTAPPAAWPAPPPAAPPAVPAAAPVPTPAPGAAAPPTIPAMEALFPATPSAPAAPVPAAPEGMSRLELELGEKWFQRIGIIVLAVAFLFLLAILLPNLRPAQIVLLDFASAIGLGVLGEYLYSRKGLRDYAKGLEIGAFGLAYIGVWGGGFFFVLADFPWPVLLGATLVVHGAASLRYRSPLLAIEAGLLYLAWILWLRLVLVVGPADLAILLSLGALGVLALVYLQRNEVSALLLTFAFDGAALLGASLLTPYGYVPVLATGLVTAVVVALLRTGRILVVPGPARVVAWAAGIVFVYSLLIANALAGRAGGVDDRTVLATYATLTAALTASELLAKDDRLTLGFAALLAALSLPVPLLMDRGELALIGYPVLLVVLAHLRPLRGYAAFPHLVYVGLVAFSLWNLRDPPSQLAAVWGVFLGVAVLHGFLQEKSGYAGLPDGFPLDLAVPFYAVALAGITAWTLLGVVAVGMYAVALPAAILLNRKSLVAGPGRLSAVVAAAGVAMIAARQLALAPVVPPSVRDLAPYLGTYHVGVLLALGGWAAYRKAVVSLKGVVGRVDLVVSVPTLLLLVGLGVQDAYSVHIFLALPLGVLAIALYLDDAVSFNAAYLAASGQVVAMLATFLTTLPEALRALFPLAAILVGIGFLLESWSSRRVLARASQLTGTASWFAFAPLAFAATVETTVAWTAAAGIAVAWGLWRAFPVMRYAGFVLFFAVLGKAFLYDIAGLEIEVRVLGLVVLAAALLVISYGYAVYRRRRTAGSGPAS